MKVYKRHVRRRISICLLFSFISSFTVVIFFIQLSYRENLPTNRSHAHEGIFRLDLYETINWHDEEFMRTEREREGNGEHGKPGTLPPDYDKEKFDKLYRSNGFNGLLSDYISINRSVPDIRHTDCRNMKYRRYLPEASIIIPIHNEHWTTLLRTVYSILNRSPAELIKEIILVDDGSTKEHMKQQLDDYVASYLPKVRVLRIFGERKGLIKARLIGAHNATGRVLIFLDSHVEANVNWLPPLLDPIVENYKTCVCPFIDVIDYETFEIQVQDEGARGAFDWELFYKRLPLLPEDRDNPTKPFKSPVMAGGLFAISSHFFWQLGGYDTGLQIWGGEQYELSFKIWQCGGTMIDAPCSRVAHIYRGKYFPFKSPTEIVGDYVGRNFKRVAEVWMDEYAEYVYMRNPHYRSIDPGDLSEQRKVREKLNCKPFKWFMEEVAFDLLKIYPLIQPPDYGLGKIVPFMNNLLCLTAKISSVSLQLEKCSSVHGQEFILSWRKDIEVKGTTYCLDVAVSGRNKIPVSLYHCHRQMGNQLWRYNLETQQFIFHDGDQCLAHNVTEMSEVYLESCEETSESQKWVVESVNRDALKKWREAMPLAE